MVPDEPGAEDSVALPSQGHRSQFCILAAEYRVYRCIRSHLSRREPKLHHLFRPEARQRSQCL